jgi:tight adherence protein B
VLLGYFLLIVILVLYLVYDYLINYQRNKIYDRVTYGFDYTSYESQAKETSAIPLLNVSAVKSMTENSAILRRLELNLKRSMLKISTGKALILILIISILASLMAYIYFGNLLVAIGVFVATIFLQWNVVKFLSDRQRKKHDEQLSTLIATMLSTMRSGGTPMQALHTTAENSPEPIASSIEDVLNNLKLGRSPNQVWKDWSDYWDSKHTKLLSSGIRLKWETGGEMTKMIEHIQETFEFSRRIELKIASVTALSKLSAIVLSIITPAIGLLIYFKRPDLMDNMIADENGSIILMVAAGLVILGYFWMRKIGKLGS